MVEDMQTTLASLLESFGEDIVAESVDFDIHLACGDTVAGAADFEVHVAEVVLVAEDIAKHCPFVAFGDESHGDAGDGFAYLDTGVHKSKAACAYCCHR